MHHLICPTRRQFMMVSGLTAVGLIKPAIDGDDRVVAADPADKARKTRAADDVLRKLLEGNKRFMNGTTKNPRRQPKDFAKVAESQNPRAVIVGCADSRVPPELLFDLGIGDLFVVRVAGNVVSGGGAVIKGSIEYAIAELGVSLVMVLGHSGCGAVKSAIQHIDAKDSLPGAINELVNTIQPAVAQTKGMKGDPLENAIKANVKIGVERLKGLEPILAGAVKAGTVKVVGGVYDLATGGVTIID